MAFVLSIQQLVSAGLLLGSGFTAFGIFLERRKS